MKWKEYYKVLAKDKYALVDSKGKIIIKFRGKSAALFWLRKEQKNYPGEKLSVVTIQ